MYNYDISQDIQEALIKAARDRGLGCERNTDGTVGRPVVEVNAATLKIEEITPANPEPHPYDVTVVDNILSHFITYSTPIDPQMVRVVLYLASLICSYSIIGTGIWRNLIPNPRPASVRAGSTMPAVARVDSPQLRPLVITQTTPQKRMGETIIGATPLIVLAEQKLLAVTGQQKTTKRRYECTIRDGAEKLPGIPFRTPYFKIGFAAIHQVELKRVNEPNFTTQAILVDRFDRSHNFTVCDKDSQPNSDFFDLLTHYFEAAETQLATLTKNEGDQEAIIKSILQSLIELKAQISLYQNDASYDMSTLKDHANTIAKQMKELNMPVIEVSQMENAQSFLANIHPNLGTLRGKKPTIFFIGPTGSGKSSLINGLMGHELIKCTVDGLPMLDLRPEIKIMELNPLDPPYAPMGTDPTAAMTPWVTAYRASSQSKQTDNRLMLADCPGFGNPDDDAKLRDEFALYLATKMNTNLRGIVIVINNDHFSGKMEKIILLAEHLSKVMKNKDHFIGHIQFIVNTKGDTTETQATITMKLRKLKERYQKTCTEYEALRQEIEEKVGGAHTIAEEYDAASEEGTLEVLKKFGRYAKNVPLLKYKHSGYIKAKKTLNLLDLMQLTYDNDCNLIVGDIATKSMQTAITQRLSQFTNMSMKADEIFNFDPMPFQQQLTEYLSTELIGYNACRQELKAVQVKIDQLTAIESGEPLTFAAQTADKLFSRTTQFLGKIIEFKQKVCHYPLHLAEGNLAKFSFYPSFYVEPYNGIFTGITLFDSIEELGVKYEKRTPFEFNPNYLPAKTIMYQSTSFHKWSGVLPKKAVGKLMGIKATHPQQQGNFQSFKQDLKILCKDINYFLTTNNWLNDVDDKTYIGLLQLIGKLDSILSEYSQSSESTAAYLLAVKENLTPVKRSLETIQQKCARPDQQKKLILLLKDYFTRRADFSGDKVSLEKNYVGLQKQVHQYEQNTAKLSATLLLLKTDLGNIDCFDFALNILNGSANRNNTQPSALSVNETQPQVHTVGPEVALAAIAAGGALFSWMQHTTHNSDPHNTSATTRSVVPLLSQLQRYTARPARLFTPLQRQQLIPRSMVVKTPGVMTPCFFKSPITRLLAPLRQTTTVLRALVK